MINQREKSPGLSQERFRLTARDSRLTTYGLRTWALRFMTYDLRLTSPSYQPLLLHWHRFYTLPITNLSYGNTGRTT